MNARLDISRADWDDTPTIGKQTEQITLGGIVFHVTFIFDDDCDNGIDLYAVTPMPGIEWDYEYYLSKHGISEIAMEIWSRERNGAYES